jgi:hemerythrin superfamily protein
MDVSTNFGVIDPSAGKTTVEPCRNDRRSLMADVVELIEQDHRAVEQLFAKFEASKDAAISEQICDELTKHTRAEETAVYPVFRSRLSDGMDLIGEAETEHEQARQLIGRIRNTTHPNHLASLMTELKEAIQHHVREEETEILPQARTEMSAAALDELAAQFESSKRDVARAR